MMGNTRADRKEGKMTQLTVNVPFDRCQYCSRLRLVSHTVSAGEKMKTTFTCEFHCLCINAFEVATGGNYEEFKRKWEEME